MIYEVKKNLVSCNLSIGFLQSLESYVRKQAEDLCSERKRYIEDSITKRKNSITKFEESIIRCTEKKEEHTFYAENIASNRVSIDENKLEIKSLEEEALYYLKIELVDISGKETISSFDEVSQGIFDNQIHSIDIRARNKLYNSDFDIRVSFSEEERDTFVSVSMTGHTAKEKAQGIIYEIARRCNNHKSYHRFFYGKINYVLYALAIIGINGYTILDKEAWIAYYLIYLFIVLAYFTIRFISPYSVLPKVKNEDYKSLKKWLFGIFVTCTIGTISYYLKSENTGLHKEVNQTQQDNKK